MVQKQETEARNKWLDHLQAWDEKSASPEKVLQLMQSALAAKMYKPCLTLLNGWCNERILDMRFGVGFLVPFFHSYAVLHFHAGHRELCYNILQACLGAHLAWISKPLETSDIAKAKAVPTAKKISKAPVSGTYSGPSDDSASYRLLTSVYGDAAAVTAALLAENNPTLDVQKQAVAWPMKSAKMIVDDKSTFPNGMSREAYSDMNPAIWYDQAQGQVWLNLRFVAWRLSEKDWSYKPHPELKYNTRNVLVPLSTTDFLNQGTLDMKSSVELILAKPPPHTAPITGMEDVKFLGPSPTSMWISFHSFEYDASAKLRMMIGKLDLATGIVDSVVRLNGFGENQAKQKNWLGFWFRDSLYFVYGWSPLTILHANTTSGRVTLASLDLPDQRNEWRGSAPPVELPAKLAALLKPHETLAKRTYRQDYVYFLAMVHHATWNEAGKLKVPLYTHRFVVFAVVPRLEGQWRYPFHCIVTHCTREFRFFPDRPVEFVNNLSLVYDSKDRANPTVVVPFGSMDRESYVTKMAWKVLAQELLEGEPKKAISVLDQKSKT